VDTRYRSVTGDVKSSIVESVGEAKDVKLADQLINTILQLGIPEVDRDLYSAKMNISAQDYATKQALEFLKQNVSHSNPFSASS
jgi:hypothetical protein